MSIVLLRLGMRGVFYIELHLGKMTNKELAQWFGISTQTMTRRKKDKLEELKLFAHFEEVYGGVNILEVMEPVYEKKKSKNFQIVELAFDKEWAKNGLDTCSNVALKIKDKHNELSIANTTAAKYALQVRNNKYGKPFEGGCEYLWCKVERLANGIAILTEFTEEEIKIKDELMRIYFKGDTEKEIIISQMVQEGELSKDEAYDLLIEIKNLTNTGFLGFKRALESKIGYEVIRGTKIARIGRCIKMIGLLI